MTAKLARLTHKKRSNCT